MIFTSSKDGRVCRCLMVFLQMFCPMFAASPVLRIFLNILLGQDWNLQPCALQQSHSDFDAPGPS